MDKIETNLENATLEDVIQQVLYTDQGLFGEIQWMAEIELYRRVPVPDWAKKHELPFTAKQAFQHLGDQDVPRKA